MKKIYWFLQQLEFIGGTETATLSIVNSLIDYYDITLIITGKEINNSPYKIDKRIKIIYLNNEDNSRMDEKIVRFCSEKKYFKAFKIILKNIFFSLFTKYKYRKYIKNITNEEDILIASSLDNYLIIPRKRKYIYHYHYNFKFYKSFNERFMSLFYRKANRYVFLDDIIYKDIISYNKKIKNISTYINNPIRFKPSLNLNYYDNNLIFIGRLAEQKDPLLLIEIMNELNKLKIDFNLSIYGEGKLYNEVNNLINKYNLNEKIKIYKPIFDIENILNDKDLLILTSIYEGKPLVINEAYSKSIPVISTNFGDSTISSIPNNTGIIVNNRDPKIIAKTIYNLLNDLEKLKEYRLNAFNFSKSYDIEVIKNKRIDLIDNL